MGKDEHGDIIKSIEVAAENENIMGNHLVGKMSITEFLQLID